jgi:hypothetical protein
MEIDLPFVCSLIVYVVVGWMFDLVILGSSSVIACPIIIYTSIGGGIGTHTLW